MNVYFFIILAVQRKFLPFQLFSHGTHKHIPILIVNQKEHFTIKKWSYFANNCTFKAWFPRRMSFVCTFSFYILSLCLKWLLSQFFSYGIRRHISILTRAQKQTINSLKNGHIFRKNILLKLNFQGEGNLDVHFLIYFLIIYREWVLFQLFSRGIRMHISILTWVQKGYISA